jgi:hypothetical protein
MVEPVARQLSAFFLPPCEVSFTLPADLCVDFWKSRSKTWAQHHIYEYRRIDARDRSVQLLR